MELVSRMMDGSIGGPTDDAGLGQQGTPAKLGQDEKMTYLQRVHLFEACSTRQLRAIARIADAHEVPAGEVLARTGEPGDRFFVIVDGSARVEVSPENQGRIGPGGFFGEMSLLDGEPRSATVIAETAMRLLVVPRREFVTLMREVPSLTQQMLITLCQRLRAAEKARTG
jgi:CRP/FNR family transcriptional regulator, cyclic AMP receptor protein